MVTGRTLNLGGTDYVVPALTLRQMRELAPDLDALSRDNEALTRVVLAALRRNYPDLTQEQVCDLLDLNNVSALVAAIFGRDPQPGGARP